MNGIGIDKVIEKSKAGALIGMWSHLDKEDKKYLHNSEHKLEKWCRGIMFRIIIKK